MSRSHEREEAILVAALALVSEVGYDKMTMDAIATRARASKATIYRKWPGKAALVVTALKRHAAPVNGASVNGAPDTGDLRTDLLAALRPIRDSLSGRDASLILGLMIAARRDPELADVVHALLIETKRAALSGVVSRAIARRLLPADADCGLAAEISSAVLFSRMLITEDPIDDTFIDHLVDAVLLPLLDRGPAGSG